MMTETNAGKDEFYAGQKFWISHKEVGYTLAVVLDVINDPKLSLTIRMEEFDEIIDIDPRNKKVEIETNISDQEILTDTNDLTNLPDLNRPSLLQSLYGRFMKNKIYTYTGDVLIAINPFHDLKSELYSKQIIENYSALSSNHITDLPPHVYYLTNQSFNNMLKNNGQNQSILVSGESGSGKTVTTKIILDYITQITQKNAQKKESVKKDPSKVNINERVIDSNPILEAFGNAKTLRNDNSSRFGKLINLYFQPKNKTYKATEISGCNVDVYLLEKGRLIHHSKGERNFHIFYELNSSLSLEEREKLHWIDVEDSVLCNQHKRRVFRKDVEDKKSYSGTLKALNTIGLEDESLFFIKKVISCVVHLGEVKFEPNSALNDGCDIVEECDEHLNVIVELLGVDKEQLRKGLLTRNIIFRSGKTLVKQNNVSQANESKKAMIMSLYERLFQYLVSQINNSMTQDESTSTRQRRPKKIGKFYHNHQISILDIFGFEVFEKNSFEQLMINYANEVLQNLFNFYIFKKEQLVYEKEKINWKKIEFPDNLHIIGMLESMLKLLDQECLVPQGNDSSYHQTLKSRILTAASKDKGKEKEEVLMRINDKEQNTGKLFEIKHFCGYVEYCTYGFIDKNRNELRREQIECFYNSNNKFLKIFFEDDYAKFKSKTKQASSLQQKTIGTNFKQNLSYAVNTKIKSSSLAFIKCIKPNDDNEPLIMDKVKVLDQLNFSGVFETIRIFKLGYSSRFLYPDFLSTFYLLNLSNKRQSKSRFKSLSIKESKSFCYEILGAAELTEVDDYQFGISRIFLKSDSYKKLENLRKLKLVVSVKILQRNIRVWLFKQEIKKRIRVRRERLRKEKEAKEKADRLERIESEKKSIKTSFTKDTGTLRTSIDEVDILSAAHSFKPLKRKRKRTTSKTGSLRTHKTRRSKASRPSKEVDFVELLKAYLVEVGKRVERGDYEAILEQDLIVVVIVMMLLMYFIKVIGGLSFFTINIVLTLLFITQMKIKKDQRKMDIYRVGSNHLVLKKKKRNNKKLEHLEYYGVESIHSEKRKKSRSRSRGRSLSSKKSSKSRKAKAKKTRSRSKKSKNKINDSSTVDHSERTLTSSEKILFNQTKRRIKSLQDTQTTPRSKRFTGLISKQSMKDKSGSLKSKSKNGSLKLKKTESRYKNVNYKFPKSV